MCNLPYWTNLECKPQNLHLSRKLCSSRNHLCGKLPSQFYYHAQWLCMQPKLHECQRTVSTLPLTVSLYQYTTNLSLPQRTLHGQRKLHLLWTECSLRFQQQSMRLSKRVLQHQRCLHHLPNRQSVERFTLSLWKRTHSCRHHLSKSYLRNQLSTNWKCMLMPTNFHPIWDILLLPTQLPTHIWQVRLQSGYHSYRGKLHLWNNN